MPQEEAAVQYFIVQRHFQLPLYLAAYSSALKVGAGELFCSCQHQLTHPHLAQVVPELDSYGCIKCHLFTTKENTESHN